MKSNQGEPEISHNVIPIRRKQKKNLAGRHSTELRKCAEIPITGSPVIRMDIRLYNGNRKSYRGFLCPRIFSKIRDFNLDTIEMEEKRK